jgi:hypothetical protein
VYDYFLGGHTNWAIDREFGDRILATLSLARPAAQANRQFLIRVVRHLMRRGVRQFIDLGAGIPTIGHMHSIAESSSPAAPKSSTSTTNPLPSPTRKSCSKNKAIPADTSPSMQTSAPPSDCGGKSPTRG